MEALEASWRGRLVWPSRDCKDVFGSKYGGAKEVTCS